MLLFTLVKIVCFIRRNRMTLWTFFFWNRSACLEGRKSMRATVFRAKLVQDEGWSGWMLKSLFLSLKCHSTTKQKKGALKVLGACSGQKSDLIWSKCGIWWGHYRRFHNHFPAFFHHKSFTANVTTWFFKCEIAGEVIPGNWFWLSFTHDLSGNNFSLQAKAAHLGSA